MLNRATESEISLSVLNCRMLLIALSVAVMATALGCSKATPTSAEAVVRGPVACTDNGHDGFITSYVTCMSEQLLNSYPITTAHLGTNLYVVYRNWQYPGTKIAVFPDSAKSLNWPAYTVPGQPSPIQNLTIAAFNGSIYVGYIHNDQRIRLQRATLDAAGNVTNLDFLGASDQTTDAFPTISSSNTSLLMAWQGRRDPPFLGFSKFDVPSNPNADFLLPGAKWFPEFVPKTRPSIAVIEKTHTIYVAYEAESVTTQVVAISEDDGKTVKGYFTSKPGFRAPTIASDGNDLFLVYCWYQNSALNITQVALTEDGIPTGFGPTRPSLQGDGSGAELISTPMGLVMAWKWAPHSQELRIGSVK